MTVRIRWFLSVTSALVIALALYTTTADVATAATASGTWCGELYYDGSSHHRFGDGTDCRKNPHAEDQAGLCNTHDVGSCG